MSHLIDRRRISSWPVHSARPRTSGRARPVPARRRENHAPSSDPEPQGRDRGLTLLVVGSWGWAANMIATWRSRRRAFPDRQVSLALHATTANALLWLLATVGVAAEMLFQLIPWSLGLVKTSI